MPWLKPRNVGSLSVYLARRAFVYGKRTDIQTTENELVFDDEVVLLQRGVVARYSMVEAAERWFAVRLPYTSALLQQRRLVLVQYTVEKTLHNR